MDVYFFGNRDYGDDARALLLLDVVKLSSFPQEFPHVNLIELAPNADLPVSVGVNYYTVQNHAHGKKPLPTLYIVDTIEGLANFEIFNFENPNAIKLPKSSSVHDYDLGFQLKYLFKLGKIGKVSLLGVPMKPVAGAQSTFQSIFRKFVAQDIQGS